MTEQLAAERDLAEFLAAHQKRATLTTWRRQRDTDELGAFIRRKLAALEDVTL